jgi:hypothetical protein
MFIVKRRFLAVFLLSVAAVGSNCFADYIADIPVERIEGTLTSSIYEWDYGYDISFSNLEMNIELRLYQRDLDPTSALAQLWETGIENTWNHKFDIVDNRSFHYHINFDVVFYSELSGFVHHSVDWTSDTSGQAAAHKAGHLIGLYDEYSGGWVNPSNPIIDMNSIMGDPDRAVCERYYQAFVNWVKPAANGRKLSLIDYDADWPNPEIPEPATIFLLGLGILLQRETAAKH